VSRAIASVVGVENVEVSFEAKEAAVTSSRCDAEIATQIADSLSAAGYGGEVVETTPGS
jgi:hypothetical protein